MNNENFKKKVESIESIGCYGGQNACDWSDVFVETLSSTQCENTAPNYLMDCMPDAGCNYFAIGSTTSMTIKWCLQICNANNFVYAGIKL